MDTSISEVGHICSLDAVYCSYVQGHSSIAKHTSQQLPLNIHSHSGPQQKEQLVAEHNTAAAVVAVPTRSTRSRAAATACATAYGDRCCAAATAADAAANKVHWHTGRGTSHPSPLPFIAERCTRAGGVAVGNGDPGVLQKLTGTGAFARINLQHITAQQ